MLMWLADLVKFGRDLGTKPAITTVLVTQV